MPVQRRPPPGLIGLARGLGALAGVEQIAGIERRLDRAHEPDRRLAVLLDEEARLAVADTVLARARPAARERAPHDAVVELLRGDELLGPVRVEDHRDVEVAVADVTD